MLSLTRKSDYALVALAFLAQQWRQEPGRVASARRIADQFRLPLPLLMNIMKELSHAGVVIATRGQQGGYALTRDPVGITLLEVVQALEGAPKLAACTDDPAGDEVADASCELADCCLIRRPIHRLHQRILGFLEQVTLADLVDSEIDVPLEHVGALAD